MLTLKFISENRNAILNGLKVRNFNDEQLSIVDQIIELDTRRKQNQTQLDQSLSQVNKLSKEIGILYKSGQADQAVAIKEKVSMSTSQQRSLQNSLLSSQQRSLLSSLYCLVHCLVCCKVYCVMSGKLCVPAYLIHVWCLWLDALLHVIMCYKAVCAICFDIYLCS